jgi:hypothetical protein
MMLMKYLLILFALWIPSAHAYVDPGSGMLLWQGLIAVIGAIIVFVRHPIEWLRRLLRRIKRK